MKYMAIFNYDMVILFCHWLPTMQSELFILETNMDSNSVFVYQTAIYDILFRNNLNFETASKYIMFNLLK